MNAKTIALVLTLGISNALAAAPKALPCLSLPDSKDCLAGVAIAALATEKSPESRLDGAASLLSSLAKAGVRHDDLLSVARDDEAAPLYFRWSFAVARRTYALRFGIDTALLDSPQRIEALAELLRGRRDGMERLMLIWSACEAREGEAPEVIAKWDGTLDRMCRIDASDSKAMGKGLPGLSALGGTVVDAYNRDEVSLRQSIAASLGVLAEYENALDRKMPAMEREAIQGMLAIGHLLNATALAISGHGAEAAKAVDMSLRHLAKVPKLGRLTEFQMILTQASWIYARVGMREDAFASLRKSLARADGRGMSGGVRATAIGISIETLRILESLR